MEVQLSGSCSYLVQSVSLGTWKLKMKVIGCNEVSSQPSRTNPIGWSSIITYRGRGGSCGIWDVHSINRQESLVV